MKGIDFIMKRKVCILMSMVLMCCSMALCGCSDEGNDSALANTVVGEETKAVDTDTSENQDENTKKGDEAKKAVLVVSFGTSFNESREKTIGAVEKKIAEAMPDYEQRRAFTSQIIIDKLAQRDNEKIDNVTEAMKKLVDDGFGTLVVQPTHVMNGEEYDEMKELIAPFEKNFVSVKYGKPLLTSSDDYADVVNAIVKDVPQLSDKTCAVVFMGHGTAHFANAAYSALDYRFKAMGFENAFVGTVEGYPDLDKIKEDLGKFKPEKVVLIPLMIVAGDHANNDMAGDEEDSWKTQLKKEGYEVECVLKGLGEYSGIQDMFAKHCQDAVSEKTEEE